MTSDRRVQIVRAALELLREEGAKGLSQPQVARRAGIPQGHLTYYFPRKADLVAAAARELQADMQRGLIEIVARTQPKDAHEASVEVVTELVMDIARSRALLGLTIESERDQDVHDVLLEIVEHSKPFVAALLGPAGDDRTVDLVQAATWGLQLQQLLRRRDRVEVRAVVERLLEWIEASRAAPPPRPRTRRGDPGRVTPPKAGSSRPRK